MSMENSKSQLAFSYEIYHPRILFLFSSIAFLLGSYIWSMSHFLWASLLMSLLGLSGSLIVGYPRIWSFGFIFFWFGVLLAQNAWQTHIEKESWLRHISGNYTYTLDITGTIQGEWKKSERYRLYRLQIDTIDTVSPLTSTSISIRVPVNLTIENRDILHWKSKISSLASDENSSFRTYGFLQDVHARGNLFTFTRGEKNQQSSIEALRGKFLERIEKLYPPHTAWLVSWILIGNTDLIREETKVDFQKSGLSHLLAVSGSNVAFLLIIIEKAIRYFRLTRKWRLTVISMVLIFYMFLVGLDIPVIRATIMGIIVYFGFSLDRKVESVVLLFLVMDWFCLYEPLSIVYDVGCTLSFLATLSILIWKDSIEKWYKWLPNYGWLRESAIISTAASIGTAPYLLYIFWTFSLLWIWANILVWPIIGWVMIFSLLSLVISIVSFYGAYIIWYSVYVLVEYAEYISHWIGSIDPGLTLGVDYREYSSFLLIALLIYFVLDVFSYTMVRMQQSQKAYLQ